ncbi:MAG: hypothetical protein LAP87_17605 [Acidobacteriia bacterium]|nr:hypothetical protein [Terriglobia bacterium]
MRHAMGALPFLLAIGSLPIIADTLPVYCGGVGAKSYTPPAVSIPPVVLNRGTVITVTNATMLINGNTSSVKALVANPGPDGISLQEAIMATNNDPGTWNIQFAPALKGATIDVDSAPPGGLGFLSGGNVTINGDIDGDGKPDITLTSLSGNLAVNIISGGNTLNGLALQGCGTVGCVILRSPSVGGGLGQGPQVTGKTFANTTLSNLVLTDISAQGTGIRICPNCAPNVTSPTGNTWDHVLITGNTITGNAAGPHNGIWVQLLFGDTLQHITIANNNIVLPAVGTIGIPGIIGATTGAGTNQGTNTVLDLRVINNTITAGTGMIFRGGGLGLQGVGSLYDGAQVIGNQITLTGLGAGAGDEGITFFAADEETGVGSDVAEPGYNNFMKNIAILGNTVRAYGPGIRIQAAMNAASNNAISNVSILGNTLLNPRTNPNSPITGIVLRGVDSYGSAVVGTGNSLNNILIQANTIQSSVPPGDVGFGGGNPRYAINSAGISVWAGSTAQGNSINGLAIANNDVNTPRVGIAITGGSGSGTAPEDGGPTFPADNNVIARAQIFCNQVDQIPTNGVLPSSGIKGINVIAGMDDAHGNQVQQLLVTDNLVGGLLGGASLLPYFGSGGSGNTITMSQASAPWPQFMPGDLVSAATFQQGALAAGTLVSLFGLNLNGATVQFDGVSAPILYSSASQVNVQVPWEVQGKASTSVTVTANSVTSAPQAISVGAADPGIFSLGAPQGGQGAIVNPAGIVVDANSPAHAGDYVEIFCTGLGAVSNTPQTGAVAVASPLSKLIGNPTVTIGGVPAAVSFAGLASGFIGLYQVNVQVPQGVAAGDAVPVMLSAGAIASNTVTISVR